MTIDQAVSDFLRDAQYRIATLTSELHAIEDKGSKRYKTRDQWRLELSVFMDIVYEGHWYIQDAYNHIQYTDEVGTEDKWTEAEVMEEIDRLRALTEMNEVPFVTFAGYYPQMYTPVNSIPGASSSVGFPAGTSGMIIFYNASGVPYADNINPYAGMQEGESINSYFSGRE